MIKSFTQFLTSIDYIRESKLFIYQRKFRIDDLIQSGIYTKEKINRWMEEYNFDKIAHAMLVTKNPVKIASKLNIRVSSRDIKNKYHFKPEGKYEGYLIEDSETQYGDDTVWLFVFKRNSNERERARQIHGFKYEGEIRGLNGLTKLKWTDRWDAEGTLDKAFLSERDESGKNIEFFNGSNYSSLVDDEQGILWQNLPDSFKNSINWSIKSIQTKSSIEMGDFKRISGLEIVDGIINNTKDGVQNFLFQVSFHDGSTQKNILEEYTIFMPIEVWRTYLPDLSNLEEYQKMYDELKIHRLKGERTDITTAEWNKFKDKYSQLTKNSVIKLRFKRDSKGQLRIQSAINYPDFMSKLLKNQHIKISTKLS